MLTSTSLGYFLNTTSISVLSIPSFDEYGDAINTFQSTITEFLTRSRAAGLQKVVIDLQQNVGGQSLLAIDTFKQFFPNIDPFAGSRMRAHPAANVMGNTMTAFWDSLNETGSTYYALAANEWVATDRIDADTGQNFTSWAEFFGPHLDNGDNFTTTVRFAIPFSFLLPFCLQFQNDFHCKMQTNKYKSNSNSTIFRVTSLMKQR
jgi:Peptidase family S41